MHTVYVKAYEAPPVDRREILRYAGVRGDAPDLLPLLEECLAEILGKLCYKVCYRVFDITHRDGAVDLGFTAVTSAALARNLAGCAQIVVFAATVGLELDRLIAKYGRLSPTKALLLQAIGAERIEALCDVFNREITAEKMGEGLSTRPRFSPGYGDLPLDLQERIFAVLDPARRIGLSLNQSLLMSPSKSVTAIIGIAGQE